jgi:hypothetical protein
VNGAAVAVREICEICATPIGGEHGHLVDMRDRRLLCACRPCYLLFVPQGAAQGRYRAVGDRYQRIDDRIFDGPHWEALQIPIGLAFFFHNSAMGRVVGFYPGPAGATESQLPLDAWEQLLREVPLIASMRPDVEAVLVHRDREGRVEAYLLPIDACYELTGLVRTSWEGIDGGDRSRAVLDEFFAKVRERCA